MSARPDIGQPHLFEPPAPVTLTLNDRFLVPPFSVLDARAGYWQDRKRDWLRIGLRSELGRGEDLLALEGTVERQRAYKGTLGALPPNERQMRAYLSPSQARERRLLERDGLLEAADKAFAEREGRANHLTWSDDPAMRDMQHYAKKRKREAAELLMRDAYAASNVTGAAPLPDWANNGTAQMAPGTSIFDPVLCELLYRWFTPQGGAILDPFAGGSVRGIVAGMLDRDYLGVDLRPEQCAANREQADELQGRLHRTPLWIDGDARDITEHAGGLSYDFLFSCPPYYDLEQYSDDPADLSNADDYPTFRDAYRQIIADAAAALRPDRYACFVVGDVRDRSGHYVGLVTDTIRAFEDAGLRLYNEAILLTQVGTLALRVSRAFGAGRKLGKSHQNVLVFVKGDGRRAADACGPVDEVALEQGGAVWRADGHISLGDDDRDLLEP